MVTTTPRIIGLCSRMPGCGKSTIAHALVEQFGFKCIPFAESLKRMMCVFLEEQGFNEAGIELAMDAGKNMPHADLFGLSPRHAMQTLGTEWGRSCIHPNVWLRCFTVKANNTLRDRQSIVVDDVRYDNEAALIRSVGGAVFNVSRPGALCNNEILAHASEAGIDSALISGMVINNAKVLNDDLSGIDLKASARLHGMEASQRIVDTGLGLWNNNFFQLPANKTNATQSR